MAEAIPGLNKILRRIESLPAEVRDKPLQQAMRKGAMLWKKQAQQNAARLGPGVKNRRTGQHRLKDSIVLRLDRDPEADGFVQRYFVSYNPRKAWWGFFVERGTEKHPAQPFLAPAPDQVGERVVDVIGRDLRKKIDTLAAK